MTVSTRRNLSDGGQHVADPDPATSQDVLWLGASAPDGSLRTAEAGRRRGVAVTTFDVPAGLALPDGGPGVPLVVVELGTERAFADVGSAAVQMVLDAVAPRGAVRLVADGAEQTRLMSQLLEHWPTGWSLEQVDAERGAVSATVRRGTPDDVVDQRSAAEQLWAALDRQARALHDRDQEARVTAHRLALRHRQLEEAVARETEGVAREDELLDEITQLRSLVRLERKARERAVNAAKGGLPRRAARLGRRALRRLNRGA